jgi:hypothetical protein
MRRIVAKRLRKEADKIKASEDYKTIKTGTVVAGDSRRAYQNLKREHTRRGA